jgi:hypothetical protein
VIPDFPTLLLGLVWMAQPVTSFIAGVVAYVALRDGLDWRGIRIAATWIIAPWLVCLVGLPLLGDSPRGGAAEFEWFVTSLPTIVSIVVAVAIGMGVVYRMGEGDRPTSGREDPAA